MPECDHRGQLHHVGQPTRLRVCGQYRRRTEGSARRPQPETFAQARQIRQPVAYRRNVQSDRVRNARGVADAPPRMGVGGILVRCFCKMVALSNSSWASRHNLIKFRLNNFAIPSNFNVFAGFIKKFEK